MLHLQANAADVPALSERLMEASSRISAVGRGYDRLAYTADYENIDLVAYLREVIDDLGTTIAPCKIELDVPLEIQFAADRAILAGLFIDELVSNAGKYAYPDCPGGAIRVRLVLVERNALLISISDDGIGLPSDFNPAANKRLGTRLVNAMALQLGAELARPTSTKGTHYTLLVPLQSGPQIIAAIGLRSYYRRNAIYLLPMSVVDAVDGSSTGTRVPRMWVLLRLPRFRGASHADDHDNRFRHRQVGFPGARR